MLLGRDELTILRGSKFYGTWQWINSVTGEPEDFAGLSAIVKIKNIHEEFSGQNNTYEVGIATVEPLDVDGNAFKGRVDIELSKDDTLHFAIPQEEEDKYGESDFYAILEILLSTGEVILQAKVRVIESLETETLNFLIDNRQEAIIINGKLDDILARNDEFVATRDNLIDVVIPTAIDTYNEKLDLYNQNHVEKLDTYNLNHTDKIQTLEDIATVVHQDKNVVSQDKLDIESMKQNVQDNKDSVTSMKDAIEIMLDNFDDRFLGRKDSDPITDNDGEPLSIAAIYYNEIDKELKFYNGASWDSPVAAAQTYAQQASQSADSANTSKLAAKTSEDNAKQSEDIATEKANSILNLTVSIQTLAPNELAISSYNPLTGVLNIGVPEGKQGEKGEPFVYEDFTAEQLQELTDSIVAGAIPDLPMSKIIDLETVLNNKLNSNDTQDILTSTETNKPLSANQGRVLKELIDNINTILSSDDTTLDEMQEVVNFIKQNKSDLQNLDLSNIAETATLKHFTQILKDKLDGVAENANNYLHPTTHDASMIDESTARRFVSDAEKDAWNAKSEFSGNYDDLIGKPTSIQSEVVIKPIITSPSSEIIDYTGNIISSDYALSSTYKGTLDYVEWQLATDVDFINIVHNKNDSLSLSYTPQNTSPTTEYFVRVRHGSDNHLSNWSDAISFTTPAAVIYAPEISSPVNNSIDIERSPIITASDYTKYGHNENHLSSDWQLATDISFTNIVVESLNDAVNLTSWNVSNLSVNTTFYARVRYKSSSYESSYSNPIAFTTRNVTVSTPSLIVTGTPNDIGKNPTLTGGTFGVIGDTDTHEMTDWKVSKKSDGTVVWSSLNDTTNKTSITSGNLEVSTQYVFQVRYKATVYGWSDWATIEGTTKAQFTPTIGTQGLWGFGTAPTDGPFALLGLAEMTGTNEYGHANYGNYIHTNGSIVCWRPKGYMRFGNVSSPRYATYGVNAIDIVGTDVFESEAEANAAGYILPRCFINNGAEQPGFFIDKYMNSKDGTASSKSVFGGVPISLTTSTSFTRSSDMTGCTGILADAVVLAKSRGARWNAPTAFMYAWSALISVAQGQAATSTTDCAWYDATGTTNFPKGCNNNALSDANDSSVVYATAGDSGNANKPKTGATANFNKTTDNGCSNGVADLNGGMFEVPIGITNFGQTATDTAAISNDTIYVLKQSFDHADLTGGWNGPNDAWGTAANLATKFDLVTSPHPLGSSTGVVYWGNGVNAVFPTETTGVNRDICGFIPKNSSASNATGINMLGNDYFYKYGIANQVPLCCGYWGDAADAGLFYRHFYSYRSNGSYGASFRASAYFA